jgi:hypothetical protein
VGGNGDGAEVRAKSALNDLWPPSLKPWPPQSIRRIWVYPSGMGFSCSRVFRCWSRSIDLSNTVIMAPGSLVCKVGYRIKTPNRPKDTVSKGFLLLLNFPKSKIAIQSFSTKCFHLRPADIKGSGARASELHLPTSPAASGRRFVVTMGRTSQFPN